MTFGHFNSSRVLHCVSISIQAVDDLERQPVVVPFLVGDIIAVTDVAGLLAK